MKLIDVVMKLVGPIDAVGETSADAERLANLKDLTELVDHLLGRIANASVAAIRDEASMKAIGMHAMEFINEFRKTDAPINSTLEPESK